MNVMYYSLKEPGTRIVQKFLWFPKKLKNSKGKQTWKWLIFSKIKQKRVICSSYGDLYKFVDEQWM